MMQWYTHFPLCNINSIVGFQGHRQAKWLVIILQPVP